MMLEVSDYTGILTKEQVYNLGSGTRKGRKILREYSDSVGSYMILDDAGKCIKSEYISKLTNYKFVRNYLAEGKYFE